MKIALIIVTLLSVCLAEVIDNRWSTTPGQPVSLNKIIVKLNDLAAPKLGRENPATLTERSDLAAVFSGLDLVSFRPLFRNYASFTENHYQFGLHQYYLVEFTESVDVQALKESLLALNSVETVDLNYQVNVATVPNDTYYPDQWAHDNQGQAGPSNVGVPDCDMDTDEAWDIEQGSEDVIIAILDTGINSHEEFTGKLLQGYNSVNGGNSTNDVFGHGSFCAGIAAARGNNGVGVAGVAWESKLLPVKVLTDAGYGDQIDLADGIQWATDNGADVISMSLQFGQDFVNVCNDAINYAVSNGTTVLAAAGNFDSNPVTYPAQYENCICVGGLSPCNERKSYGSCDGENFWGSNYGSDLDFLTPCVLINTTTNTGGYTSTFNGTSSACPAAAGVAALVMSVSPNLSPIEVREIMDTTTDDLYTDGFDIQSGNGRLNAHQAVALAFEMACENNWIPGDVNNDSDINVLDLVLVANMIIGLAPEPDICQDWAADYNQNGVINVLDIIQIINIIVG